MQTNTETNTETNTVADILVDTLHNAGLDIVFGLPGGENVEVIDALRRAGIRFVLVRNESSAVYMADVYARLTGKLGVALTTLGPGATNAFVGVAHADLDRAPVILITAETNQSFLPGHTHQVYDLQTIFAPITKLTVSLTPENVRQAVADALRLTTEGRPGPVHLSLSREMAAKEVPASTSMDAPATPTVTMGSTAAAHAGSADLLADLAAARSALEGASRPVLLVGVGMEPEGCYAAVEALAAVASAPIIVTPKSKGAISDRHRLAAGALGITRADPVYEILDEADLIVAVGFDVVELVKPWDQTQPTIWVAPFANADAAIPAVAEFVGPMEPALNALAECAFETDPAWGATRVAALHAKLAAQLLPTAAAGRMLPQAVLRALRANVSDETLITTDVGSHKICTALEWPAYVPNRYMLSNGLSAMSFGVTGAMAGALALDEPTVCVTGDAGFSMVMGELSLLTELDLPLIIVVMNDSALDLIRAAQHRAGKPAFGTEFTNPDFSKIADAFGLDFYRVADEAACAAAVQAAVAKRGPVLIEALIDPISYPTTPKS